MHTRLVVVALLGILVGAGVSSVVASARSSAQPPVQNPRWQFIGREPVGAAPNSIVPPTTIWFIKDVQHEQCYLMFVSNGLAVSGPNACPTNP